MKKLLVLSGKGGTGKTTTASAFIHFAKAKAFADCDVDAPNLHLINGRETTPETTAFIGSKKAVVNPSLCTGCEACVTHCRFGALAITDAHARVNEYACEGCGVCAYVCSQQAINLCDDVAGDLTLYPLSPVFSTAKLKMGRGNSGKLVSAVKKNLFTTAMDAQLAIIDGSPGIGCPVIASISGVSLVLIVTEPSLSGLSDLSRIVQTVKSFQTKVVVCINKFDTCISITEEIKQYCLQNEVPFVGCIPYDSLASKAINEGKSIAEVECEMTTALRHVFDQTMAHLS